MLRKEVLRDWDPLWLLEQQYTEIPRLTSDPANEFFC
jgi:hypothetical protein